MDDPSKPPAADRVDAEPIDLDQIGHPRGTLVIVILYALVFGLSWLALYVYRFLPAGPPHP
jgi:hypothetical protein